MEKSDKQELIKQLEEAIQTLKSIEEDARVLRQELEPKLMKWKGQKKMGEYNP